MRVLVSAFEPFDGQPVNASWEGVLRLDGETIGGARVEVIRLPVLFGASFEHLWAEVEARKPDLVVMVGEAGDRPDVCVERVAFNLQDASIPDNGGHHPRGVPVIADGPGEYVAKLPVGRIAEAIAAAGIAARVSDSAGRYVCNDLYYRTRHRAFAEADLLPVLFIHVPRSGMAPSVIAEALRIGVAVTLDCANPAVSIENRRNLQSTAARAGTPASSIIEKG